MTWLNSPRTVNGPTRREQWYVMGRRAQQSGEVHSLNEMPEPEHDTGQLAEGCHLAWMMGYMDAFMQQMRALTEVQHEFNQTVNESLVHPRHRVAYDPSVSPLLEDALEASVSPLPEDALEAISNDGVDAVNRINPVLDNLLRDAERAYRERTSPPADEPEVVNPGTRNRRMIEI